MITDYTECCIQYFCTSLYSLRQIYHHQPQWSTYYYDIFLIHMICFKIKKIKRGKLEKIYQLILWKWKTEIAFLRNQLHIWLLKQQNKKYQIDESKNNQKARNKRPNLHNLWGNNCQFSDNIFQWHFHLFREFEDGVVFPYKLNCSCVEKRLHVYILFF